MKIYTTNNTETDSVEILLDYQELKKLVSSLKKFEDEVNQFKMKNKDAKGLGFTHLHLKDYILPSELAGSAYIAATTCSSSRRTSGGKSNAPRQTARGRNTGPVRMTV